MKTESVKYLVGMRGVQPLRSILAGLMFGALLLPSGVFGQNDGLIGTPNTAVAGSFSPAATAGETIDKGEVEALCDGRSHTIYTEPVDTVGEHRIRVTIRNTGDCSLRVVVAGKLLFEVTPDEKKGENTGIPAGETVRVKCSKVEEEDCCEFKWRIRG